MLLHTKRSLLLIIIVFTGLVSSFSCGKDESTKNWAALLSIVNISGTVKDYQFGFAPVLDAKVHAMEVFPDGTLIEIDPPSFTGSDGIFHLDIPRYGFYALWAKSDTWEGGSGSAGTPQHVLYYRRFTSNTSPSDITLEVGSAKPPDCRTTSGGYLKILRESVMLESYTLTIEVIDSGNDLLTSTTAGENYLVVGTVKGKSADEQGLRYIEIPEGSYKVSFNGDEFTIFVEEVVASPPHKSTFLYIP